MNALQQITYRLSEGMEFDALVAALAPLGRVEIEPRRNSRRVYYDSFDWRLYGEGLRLLHEEGRELALYRVGKEAPLATFACERPPPRFLWELPEGHPFAQLSPVVEMRAFLPQARVESHLIPLRLCNQNDKTVVRMTWEAPTVQFPERGPCKPMERLLHILPVRGYDKQKIRVMEHVEGPMGLVRELSEPLMPALAALGRQPGGYSTRPDIPLAPGARADGAVKAICLHLLETLEANVPGTKADLDSEFLHDLRVAVRRTRSILTQVKGVFPAETVARFKTGFAWIGKITGPTRDLDVYLLSFDEYRNALPETYRADLAPLHEYLGRRQALEQKALVRSIGSPHFRKLIKEWRLFLESPLPEEAEPPNAKRPVGELAGERIYRMYRRVVKEGRAVSDKSPPEALHELRKSCKKLRYLLEFFRSLYPDDTMAGLIRQLKRLLNTLGEFQDLEVQSVTLSRFAQEMANEGKVPVETLLAIGMLVEGLLQRQQQARLEFARRFEPLAGSKTRPVYKRLFSNKAGKTGDSA